MDNYIVSALKYRPTTFKSVVGQKSLTTTLKNAILTNKLAHAYLFCGPRGVGKTTCARIFAKTINCTNLTADGEACNECESCRSFNEQRSLNIYELDAASNNSVDDIRTLIEQVRIPPQSGKYKVYIIDEVHMLSTAAFNAFLKTLEEPPQYVIFILATTEKHKVLPTILSRCQIYDFSRISVGDIVDHLAYVAESEHIHADRDALNIIAMKADGGMRDSLSIFDQAASFTGGNITYQNVIENLNVLDYEYYFKLTDLLLTNKVSESLLLFDDILTKGFEGSRFIGGLASHFRDLLVAHDAATVKLLETSDSIRERYIAQAKQCPVKFLYRAIRLCNDCDVNYRTNRNKRLLVELTLIELAQLTEAGDDSSGSRGLPPITHQLKKIQPAANAAQATATGNNSAQQAQPQQPQQAPVGQAPATPAPTQTAASQPAQPAKSGSIPDLLKGKAQKSSSEAPKVNISQLGVSMMHPVSAKTKQEKQVAQAMSTEGLGNDPITADKLRLQIAKYAQTLPVEQKALSVQMQGFVFKVLDPNKFEFVVNNELVVKELNNVKQQMLGFLRKELNNAQLEMSVRVSEEGEIQRPVSRQDKFKFMAEKNKTLLEFQKKFGLELG
jgi:DNA polymerase-3 subunit gamma/tau